MLTLVLISTWAFLLIGWFAPGVFKFTGAGFYALGEACEDLRDIFNRQFAAHRRKGLRPAKPSPVTVDLKRDASRTIVVPAPVADNPLLADLTSALTNQGVSVKKAQLAARKALESGQHEFEGAFRMALSFAR